MSRHCFAHLIKDRFDYQFITKPRNKYGGGVAILIKEGIEFIQDFSYEEFNSELLCIKMNLGKNTELFVFSLYNPPNVLLNFEFFKQCRNYILGGDLSARTKQIGCVGENENGIMLKRKIDELVYSNYFEILDLYLVSFSLIDKITDFCVLNSKVMTSDHFPIEASISMGYQLENKSGTKKSNYTKANWQLFSDIINSQKVNITEISLRMNQLNDKIIEKIITASHKSIPYLSQKIDKTSLPHNIVNLIKERRKIRRNFQKIRCQKLKQKFNQLTFELKASLKKFCNHYLFDFIGKMGKNPLTRSNLIPNLILNEKEFKTNEEKGKCFG
ncbi:RNA-directed DNA polymerase from mobile element jockey-like [Brachionus plicatilis]|uniref:RNA-directed DNA polymerase from mobile element jockey-like n=1 Tax=Brachionus plicatilis TaxID=10195 RepID=A0A3M7SG89_BRAPC|nr:RNA-directed DNA polymerase from mobile element jockey-like [Brachionus plicatilis]